MAVCGVTPAPPQPLASRGGVRGAPHPATGFQEDYMIRISIPACAGTSAQTPVGRSPSFSGAESVDGQP